MIDQSPLNTPNSSLFHSRSHGDKTGGRRFGSTDCHGTEIFNPGGSSRDEFLQLLDAVPSGVLILDGEMIVAANRETEELLGNKSRFRLAGKNIMDIIDPVEREALSTVLHEKWRPQAQPHGIEIRCRKASGEIVRLFIRTARIHWGGAPWIVIFASNRDRDNPQCSQRTATMGSSAIGVAHDVNNMLGVIIGHAELMSISGEPLSRTREADLESILQAAKRSRELTQRLMSIGRRNNASPQPVELGEILDETLRFLTVSLPNTITIERTVDPGPHTVLGDPIQLHQVVMNLCINAIQAMDRGEGLLRLILERICHEESTARKDRDRALVRLTVHDTGCGVSEEYQERIFDPYFTTKKDGLGTGLGLSVVRDIVEHHEGEIHIEDVPEGGTIFKVTFPLHNPTSADTVIG